MSNWCLGCHREIPDGDYCDYCKSRLPWREEDEIDVDKCDAHVLAYYYEQMLKSDIPF